jgi:hypothetical protein
MVDFRSLADRVEHHAGFHAGHTALGIDLQNAAKVLRTIHDDCCVTPLASKTRATSARQNRRVVRPAHLHGPDDVLNRAGKNYTHGHLTVVRGVGCVQRTIPDAEPDLSLKRRLEILF